MNALGSALLLVAALLALAEMAAPGIGVAGVGAAVTLILGVALLVGDGPGPDVSPALAAPLVVAAVAAASVVGRRIVRSHRDPSLTTGTGAVLARETTVRRRADGPAQGFVAGAWWTLRGSAGAELSDGDRVLVVGVDGLVLEVEPVPGDPAGQASLPPSDTPSEQREKEQ